MKTIEEKAKAYDEVLKQIKECIPDENGFITIYPQEIFPELAESEDERIVKELLTFFRESMHGGHILTNKEYDSWIAWLEKQKNCIKLSDSAYTSNRDVVEFADKYSHAVWENLMNMFKKIENYSIGCNDVSDIVLNAIINTYNWLEKQKQQEKDIMEDAILDGNEDGLIAETIKYKNEKQSEKKPAWNKEDKGIIEEVVSYLINYSNIVESKEDADRIEYLIDKIQDIRPHQKQEWSEEDEQHIDSLLKRLDALCRNKFERTRFAISEDRDWLKSLRPLKRWKPSDEQMEALDWQIENTSVGSWQYKVTKELLADLKKLKEGNV